MPTQETNIINLEIKITGLIESILYKNELNGYYVAKISFEDGKTTTVTLNHVQIHEGVTMDFYGYWTNHQKYGTQFKVTKCFEAKPNTNKALVAYLSSKFFPGIGPVIATKIVNHFGDKSIDIFNTNINKILRIPGISKKKLEVLKESWEKHTEINDIMVFLQTYNISTLFAAKIYETYGTNCISKIQQNPYTLCRGIKGIGFKKADKIALEMGVDKDSFQRIKAGTIFFLETGQENGNCYETKESVLENVNKLLEIQTDEKILEAVEVLIKEKEIKVLKGENDLIKYYLKEIYFNELYCAEKIAILSKNKRIHDGEIIRKWLNSKNVATLTEEQLGSIKGIISKGLSVLTGGPGVGKTTTLKYLVGLLNALGVDYVLAAPTGRAAKRMAEVIGSEAKTIHRLLGWNHELGAFIYDEENQLDAEFVIIDESSMIDINLAAALLKAVRDRSQVLFIGDVDQLPPVGPGSFFKDMIDADGEICVFKLEKIHRQSAQSSIIKFAHSINKGDEPYIPSPISNPNLWAEKEDCMFIDSGKKNEAKNKAEYSPNSTLRYGMDVIDTMKKIYLETIPKYSKDSMETQILTPMNIGDYGAENLNRIIQLAINPPAEGKKELDLKTRIFRVGDKVIQTVNNYDIEVFNGEIGKIHDIDKTNLQIKVYFESDDKTVIYNKSDILDLKLAYAITIHKSQGSEFENIIIILAMQHYNMLYRNLVYTGLTRAKKLCVFIGERSAFKIAVGNKNSNTRNTSLKELIQKKMRKV